MGDSDQQESEGSSDSTADRFRGTYDWSTTEPSIAVIDALETVWNSDPSGLATGFETPLYDYVDPDALDKLVGDEKLGCLRVTFTVGQYRIRFEGDELLVGPRER